jgi:DnaJ-class molecular chaperone
MEELERQEKGSSRNKGADLKIIKRVTLEELYKGFHEEMPVNRKVYCHDCHGTGAEGGALKTCSKCGGKG